MYTTDEQNGMTHDECVASYADTLWTFLVDLSKTTDKEVAAFYEEAINDFKDSYKTDMAAIKKIIDQKIATLSESEKEDKLDEKKVEKIIDTFLLPKKESIDKTKKLASFFETKSSKKDNALENEMPEKEQDAPVYVINQSKLLDNTMTI